MKKLSTYLLLFFLLGCTAPVQKLELADASRFTIQQISRIKTLGPMAIAPDGQSVAWSDADLNLHQLSTPEHSHPLDVPADAVCWSPDGRFLAATARMDGESHLYVFDRSGAPVYDLHLPGRVARLQWPASGRLTAGLLSTQAYSFGTHVKAHLLTWDGRWKISRKLLYETTLTPSTAQLFGPRLFRSLDFDLSPLEDEVLYTRIYAPPAFAASRQLLLKNLQTGRERVVSALPLLKGSARLAVDGESMLIDEGLGVVRMEDMWSGKALQEWEGEQFAFDHASELVVTNSSLYQGRHKLIKLPPGSRAQVSPGGRFLAVAWQGMLYHLTGYPVMKEKKISGVQMKKLQKLRRLRSRELITLPEYRQARERVLR